MKLYYTPNLNPRLAVAVARYLNSPVRFVRAHPFHPDHQEAFLKINPNQRAPVLEEDDGSYLWETDAIACRLSSLAGSDFWRRGDDQVEMIKWISWGTHYFMRTADRAYFERVVLPSFMENPPPPDEAEIAKDMEGFRGFCTVLNDLLKDREWLVGDSISYGDFRVATPLPFAEKAKLPFREYDHIVRWYAQLEAIDAWREPFNGLEI